MRSRRFEQPADGSPPAQTGRATIRGRTQMQLSPGKEIDMTTYAERGLKSCRCANSTRLPELEYVAFGIVAVADPGAFEFPLALHCIHGSAELCRALTRVCDVLDSKHELEWGRFAKFRRRGDFDFVCDAVRYAH